MNNFIKIFYNNSLKAYYKYLLIGLVSTVIYLLTLMFCVEILNLTPTISSCVAFIFSLSFGYKSNKSWTFKVEQKSRKFFIKFFLARLSGLILTAFLTYFYTAVLKINYMVAQIFILSIVITMNFFMTKYWVFRIKQKKTNLQEYMEINNE